MSRFLRPSPAMVVAVIALVFALTGAAVAATGSDGAGGVASAAKKKKKKKKKAPKPQRGPRGFTGPPGATGPRGPSNAFEAFRDGPTTSAPDGTDVTVATLSNLPAGAYAIRAKANITRLAGGTAGIGGCTLTAGGDADGGNTTLQNGLLIGSTVSTQLTHTFTATGSVTLSCTANGGTAQWTASQIKIVAIQLDKETHTAVTG